MDTYASVNFYKTEHGGAFSGSDDKLERLLYMASRRIDSLTFNRIVRAGFARLTAFQQELVRRACCFQADYFDANGIDSPLAGINGYSVLDISVTNASRAEQSMAAHVSFSEAGYELLNQTGLLWRVIG